MKIKKGQRIFIKPEWQDAGDDQIEFVAVEDMEDDSNRVFISDRNSTLFIIPQHLIFEHMIDWDKTEKGN